MAGCLGCVGIQDPSTREIRVLTYNIHHGEGTDGRLDLERIAQVIKTNSADLVALQEIDQNAARTGGIDQAAELARLTGMHYVFGKAMDFQGGAYGQAILSRWPIKAHEVHQLPQRSGREPRIVLIASVPALTFASTHLDHQLEEVRVEQAAALNALFRTNTAAVILAGDFNATPPSKTMSTLAPQWQDAAVEAPEPTVPSGKPSRRIDYILCAPKDQWQVISTRVLDEPIASDHRPVLAVVRLAP